MKEKIVSKLKEIGAALKKYITDPEVWLKFLAKMLWTASVSMASYVVGAMFGVHIAQNTTYISDEDIAKGDEIETFYDATNDTYHCKPKD